MGLFFCLGNKKKIDPSRNFSLYLILNSDKIQKLNAMKTFLRSNYVFIFCISKNFDITLGTFLNYVISNLVFFGNPPT
jgi:hypothetical protein